MWESHLKIGGRFRSYLGDRKGPPPLIRMGLRMGGIRQGICVGDRGCPFIFGGSVQNPGSHLKWLGLGGLVVGDPEKGWWGGMFGLQQGEFPPP